MQSGKWVDADRHVKAGTSLRYYSKYCDFTCVPYLYL